nr:excalibur calcium-binding domain-containing protein [Novosphingobium sp. PhB55]
MLPSHGSAVSSNAWAYYANCNEARAAGAAPLYQGEPGYRSPLDADGDGIAWEPYRGSHSHRRRLRFPF